MSRRNSGRAGGGTSTPAFTPMDLAPYIWLEADSGVTESGNRTSAYVSKTNGISFAQATDASKPLYIGEDPQYNDLPVIQIDGAAVRMDATVSVPAPFSVFEYGHYDSGTISNSLRLVSRINFEWDVAAGEQRYVGYDGSTTDRAPQITDTPSERRSLYAGLAASGVVTISRNAGTPVTGANARVTTSDVNTFARIGASAVAQIKTTAAYLIFKRELTSAEITQLHNYFEAKYGNTVAVSDDDIHALVPYSWMDADTYTVDGVSGKVASFPDKVTASTGIRVNAADHAYVQADSTYQTAVPTANAALNNEPTANFNAGPYYSSNATPAEFNCLHDGTGCEVFYVVERVASSSYYLASVISTHGVLFGSTNHRVFNGGAAIVTSAFAAHAATAHYYNFSYIEAATPEYVTRDRSAIAASGASTGAPTASDAQTALTIGAISTGSGPMNGKLAMSLIFNRVLTVNERALVQSYLRQRFGL